MRNGRKVITLTIDPVQSIHYGDYTCLAENVAGKASYSAKLHVNGIKEISYCFPPPNSSLTPKFTISQF